MDSGLSTKAYKQGNPFIVRLKCDGDVVEIQHKSSDATLPRKVSKDIIQIPVPRTDTGGQGEYPKVSERTMVKELGKMTP